MATAKKTELKEGDVAPDFALESTSGKKVKLSTLKGKNVVLYFYPRDDTPGCTAEACSFRDNLPRFNGAEATILGVSRDITVEKRAEDSLLRLRQAVNYSEAVAVGLECAHNFALRDLYIADLV